MRVSRETVDSLQIFKPESHPSVFKLGRGFREGLSLFGISDRCRSKVGRAELRYIRSGLMVVSLMILLQRNLSIANP